MKKLIITTILLCALVYVGSAQIKKGQIDPKKIPVPQGHYQSEYTFDQPVDKASWAKQPKGLQVAFGSTNELYLRSEVPAVAQEAASWKSTGWRGERLNAQVLVWATDTIEQIRFVVSDLVNSNGKVIGKENVRLNMVRYVVSNLPYNASNFDCGVANDSAYLMPDRFESFDRFDLPGHSVRPVWVSVEIPTNADPGEYTGTMEVHSLNGKVILNVSLKVQKQELPKPHDWKFRLDLWQNPWVIAWYYHVEPWSAEHKALLKQHLKLYADLGGTYITTYAVHSPWSDNSYWIEGTMIDWIKSVDGKWKFNYSIFDQYVSLAMESGIDEAITIYTPVPWGHRFRYMDEKTGNYIHTEWAPSSSEFKAFWNVFLDDLKAHLTQKGWLKKAYLGINENPMDVTLAAIKVIKDHSKDWRLTYAGDWHPELSSLLDDYSPVISSEASSKEMKERADKGFTTTYYVCCTPVKPNNFVFSPPAEGRYISWYAAAYGYDGFLRWAYDAWPADPVRDARHKMWPAGDCFLVYPGGTSCIRYEKLREGIVDYEKIHILRELASKSTDKKVKEIWSALEAHLSTLTAERDYKKRDYSKSVVIEAVDKGNRLIRDLSDELGRYL
ncbi:MAG TPA: glycoside hydrolase domain-containing protein [Prolixibacteraceae bacterium]|nr:glycoside hydrolase domain-containing protein [Prolixibacteraceae bacterium]